MIRFVMGGVWNGKSGAGWSFPTLPCEMGIVLHPKDLYFGNKNLAIRLSKV